MRRIKLLSIILVLVVCGVANAAENDVFSLSGYCKNLVTRSESPTGEAYAGDLSRLRLDAEYRPADDVTFKLVLDNEAIFGTLLDTAEFKSGKNARQGYSTMQWTFVDSDDLWGRTSVHRLYLEAKSGNVAGTFGRQRIAWGTGRLWNPVDVFNPVSPLAVERDERLGTDAASLVLYPGPLSSITAVYAPEREGHDDCALRTRTNLGGYDFALVAASLNNRDLAGIDFAGNLGDSSLRGEATREALTRTDPLFPARRDRFTRAVLSWDYTFPSTLYVLLEYLYNGGNVREDVSSILYQTEILTRNRNFAAAGFGYDLTPLVRPECTVIMDLDEDGVVADPILRYNVRENIDWTTGGLIFRRRGEYAEQHNLYYTSVKVYF